MSVEYMGLSEIHGPLVVLDGVKDAFFEEIVEIKVNGKIRTGRIIEIMGQPSDTGVDAAALPDEL